MTQALLLHATSIDRLCSLHNVSARFGIPRCCKLLPLHGAQQKMWPSSGMVDSKAHEGSEESDYVAVNKGWTTLSHRDHHTKEYMW